MSRGWAKASACLVPDGVAPVFDQVVSPPLGLPRTIPLSSHIADYIYDFCPLPDPDVGLSILVCGVEHTSFHFGLGAATHELYTCLFRQV